MPIDFSTNLSGRVNVVDFAIAIGHESLSSDFQKVTIPFTGTANPARTNSVDVISAQYSLNSGDTWADMTLVSADSDTSNLTFDVDGEEYNLVWQAKTDIGTNIYNNNILIRIRAQAAFSGDIIVATKQAILYFSRSVTNQAQIGTSAPFPEDYSGTPGTKLLENAPRQQG